jgi:hypothetical protein
MMEYRKGNIDEARELYNAAITGAKKRQKSELAAKARLNMIREEIRAVDNYDEKLLNEMETLYTDSKIETEQLRNDILIEVKKKAEKKEAGKTD